MSSKETKINIYNLVKTPNWVRFAMPGDESATRWQPELTVIESLQIKPEQVDAVASLYAEVFKGPPWNEAVKCPDCQQFKGQEIKVGSICSCGGCFQEAYPLAETKQYIEDDMGKNSFRSAVASYTQLKGAKPQVIGFAWSYLTNPEKLTMDKWIDPQNQQKILELLYSQGLKLNKNFRYLSEVGVDNRYRGLGVSNYLAQKATDLEPCLYRTNAQSPMMAVGPSLGFTQIMGPEVIIDRSAKVIIPTGKVISRLDSERPDRVLFIKL